MQKREWAYIDEDLNSFVSDDDSNCCCLFNFQADVCVVEKETCINFV